MSSVERANEDRAGVRPCVDSPAIDDGQEIAARFFLAAEEFVPPMVRSRAGLVIPSVNSLTRVPQRVVG